MLRFIVILTFWGILAWSALRILSRVGKLTRPKNTKDSKIQPPDPLTQAKKADVIDIK